MAKFETILTNPVTGEQALIKSNDPVTFESRVVKKQAQWDKQNHRARSNNQAASDTKDALARIEEFKSILLATLDKDDKIDWEEIQKEHKLTKPKKDKVSEEINVYGGLNKIPIVSSLSFVKSKVQEEQTKIDELKAKAEKSFMQAMDRFNAGIEEWQNSLKDLKGRYESNTPDGIQEYINLVLERSSYPDNFNLNYEFFPSVNEKILIIEVELPKQEEFPSVIEYKYVQSRGEITSKEMKQKDFESFYNDVIYQIILRTAHEVFEADYQGNIEVVVINKKTSRIDKKIGKEEVIYIASLQVNRDEFEQINLSNIDPKESFRHLKGVSAGSLINLSPVKPIMKVNTEDGRIIQASSVIDGIGESDNLATMDWQEFEILVRDLISKEFSDETSKVEVTRVSRDAGVDAIAFDEDPIKGGKYVIQAKRYNNLVPVSAVRDLYGTVMNEGAVKGILITTSYYGRDAIDFAKDKPLKLINGEELLYMFNKHGYKVKIELQKKKRAISKTQY